MTSDVTIFLASRGEHYGYMMVCGFFSPPRRGVRLPACSGDGFDYGGPLKVWAVVQILRSGIGKGCNVDAIVALPDGPSALFW